LNVPVVDIEACLSLYRALEQAISAGVVASCRGIYRGGLVVHAAMVAFGGELGMTLDLGKVLSEGSLRDDHVLFSESCGRFLLTVPSASRTEFESFFAGLPCSRVGEITSNQRLVIWGQDGKVLVDESVKQLKASWETLA